MHDDRHDDIKIEQDKISMHVTRRTGLNRWGGEMRKESTWSWW